MHLDFQSLVGTDQSLCVADLYATVLQSPRAYLLAFGIRWVPDPKKRGLTTAKGLPADAYSIATSKDAGQTWVAKRVVIDCAPEFGVIARPLPHIFEGALWRPPTAPAAIPKPIKVACDKSVVWFNGSILPRCLSQVRSRDTI